MAITFYYSPQSNATRVKHTLAELGIDYEEKKIDLRAGDQKKPELLALNPNGKVPTIVIDGTPMFESVAIQIALGERYGVEKGLWPALGSPEHLTALTWLVWGQVSLGGAVMRYMSNTSDWIPKEQHNTAAAEASLKETHNLLGMLEAQLGRHEYLTGGTCTLADMDLASVLGWALYVIKLDLGTYPKIAAWLNTIQERPAIKALGHTA